ncbi:aldo/keto reductase [Massilia sp. DWR3-1-1]|uniref:aldo/keto reductase n=1 Tax=Massilia sp. DWR3-1-1 TaxID=2804559 RepID=UPI003CE7A207
MRTLSMPGGRSIPVLGQGTWNMGEDPAERDREADALRLGLDLGLCLIDTAEMYGEGGAERVVAQALAGRREQAYIVSKVYPHNAGRRAVQEACERSLRRLGTDRIELYLLHWRGGVPLAETFEGFEALKAAGKIVDYGVSNFDRDDMLEAHATAGGAGVAVNQVLYNLARRGVEWDLLPWCRQHGVPLMAYSPLEQAGMLGVAALRAVASLRGVTPAQVALAWLLRQDGIIAIPKAVSARHVRENAAAVGVTLEAEDLAVLDTAFAPPRRATPLAMR